MVFSSNELDILILQNGEDGISADSKYIWVKYSANADGSGLTDDPTNAIYIGIAYNKDTATESNDPSDYTWTKIKGDNGSDGYTIVLNNENISFSVGNGNTTPIRDQTYEIVVSVFQGTTERDDFTIGELSSDTGITISKQNDTITISVDSDTDISKEEGTIQVPVSIDGLVFLKQISWNVTHQGEIGQGAVNIIMGNESQNIPCTNDGIVLENMLINIPFTGYIGTQSTATTAVVGLLPSGITLGSNTPSSDQDSGLIVLNVAKSSDLGGNNILFGNINITFTVGSTNITKSFAWSKTKDGAEGSMTIYDLEPSTLVINKDIEDVLNPSSVTFSAYTRSSNSPDRSEYLGMFIIEESDNGTSYTNKYTSSKNESSVSYTPSSSSIHSIRCTLCQTDNIAATLDRQTVLILNDSDSLKPIIEEITTSISGVETEVDNVSKAITDKIWQSDITESINNYDGTTIKTIRDQVSENTTEIGQITSSVSDIQSTLTTKADGSTVQELTEKVSTLEQDAEGFKQTVSSTYATKDELSSTSETLQSTIEQTAGEIRQNVTDLEGNITEVSQTVGQIEQRVENAEGDISSLQQTAEGIETEISNARGDKASLSARFDEITSQVETVDGKVSEVEQTAEAIKSEVAEKQPIPLTTIRYIRDWLNGNTVDNNNYFVECRVVVDEEDIALGLTAVAKDSSGANLANQPTNISVYTDDHIIDVGDDGTINTSSYVSTGTGLQCLELDLGTPRADIDYIEVIHYYPDKRIYNHKLEISEDGNKWITLYDSEISGGYIESQDGRLYPISDGYINNKISQVTQTVNGISSIVQNNSDSISRLEQTSSSFSSTIQEIQSDVNNVNESIQNINEEITANQSSIEQTFNEIRMSITGMTDDMEGIAQSVVEQSSTEWKALFSQIGMGDYPDKNTNVIMSANGLTVRNPDTGVETVMSPDQFIGRYLGNVVFQLNKDLTITRRIQVDNGADFTTIKYINKIYTSGSNQKIGALVHIKSGGSS